jgi:hypothetical protein
MELRTKVSTLHRCGNWKEYRLSDAGKKYKPWLFHQGDNCEALLADMVATIQNYGPPFMQEQWRYRLFVKP